MIRLDPVNQSDERHGTYYGYNRLGCKCRDCTDAAAKYRRDLRRSKPPLPPGDPAHGTPNAYTNLMCRCAACRRAWSDYSFRWRVALKQSRNAKRLPRAIAHQEPVS